VTSQLVLARLRFCWSFLRQRCPCSGRALQRAQLALRPPAAARAWATHGVEDQVIKAPNTASMNSTYRVPGLDEWPQAPFFIRSRIGQLPTVNAPLVSLGASSRQWCEARATLLGSAAGASTETCFVCCVLCVVCCVLCVVCCVLCVVCCVLCTAQRETAWTRKQKQQKQQSERWLPRQRASCTTPGCLQSD